MKKLLITYFTFIIALLLLAQPLCAQRRNGTTPATQNSKKEVVDEDNYNAVLSFGLTTNTNSGLLGGFMIRKEILVHNNSPRRQYHYINLEIVSVDHYRESSYNSGGNGSSFSFGKKNYLFAIRPQFGREINLFRKSSEGGVNINAILAGGPTIGIVKPYYVQIFTRGGPIRDEPYNPDIHNINNIAGSGGFFEGFGSAKITPGVNLKAALNFELDAFRQSNISLEIGFLAEAYAKKIDIMASNDNRSVFTSGYLTLFFGGKK